MIVKKILSLGNSFRLHRRRGTGRVRDGAEDTLGFAGAGKHRLDAAQRTGGEVKVVPLLDGRLLTRLLENGVCVGIASHDEKLVWHALQLM